MSSLGIFLNSIPQGLSFIVKHRLFGYFLKSGLIALVLLAVVAISSWFLGGFVGSSIAALLPDFGAKNPGILKWTGRLTTFILAFILFKYLVLIATGPLMSALSEKIENKYASGMNRLSMSFTYSMYRGIKLSIRNLAFELILTLLILALNLIPLLSIIVPILLFIIQAYYAGIGVMDYTLERFKSVKGTTRFARNNRIMTTGYGSIYLVLLLIPIVGVFFSPVITTAVSTHGTLDILLKDQT